MTTEQRHQLSTLPLDLKIRAAWILCQTMAAIRSAKPTTPSVANPKHP